MRLRCELGGCLFATSPIACLACTIFMSADDHGRLPVPHDEEATIGLDVDSGAAGASQTADRARASLTLALTPQASGSSSASPPPVAADPTLRPSQSTSPRLPSPLAGPPLINLERPSLEQERLQDPPAPTRTDRGSAPSSSNSESRRNPLAALKDALVHRDRSRSAVSPLPAFPLHWTGAARGAKRSARGARRHLLAFVEFLEVQVGRGSRRARLGVRPPHCGSVGAKVWARARRRTHAQTWAPRPLSSRRHQQPAQVPVSRTRTGPTSAQPHDRYATGADAHFPSPRPRCCDDRALARQERTGADAAPPPLPPKQSSTPIHQMFSSSAHHGSQPEYDAHGQARHSPDIDHSAADPLHNQFADYDEGDHEQANSRRYVQGLSASGVAGYQSVGGDQSEPGSPTHGGEGYERSNESGSSGTKVDAGRTPRPDTMSSEGSYENGGNRTSGQGGNHTVSS